MKLKHFLALFVAGLSLGAVAKPAYPGIIRSENPDGSVTEIRLHGDEHFSYVTDSENVRILEKDARGYWKTAMRNGKELLVNDESISLLQAENMASNPAGAPKMEEPARMAGLDNDGRSTFPTLGEHHFPVVLIEFSDRPYSVANPHEEFYKLCNEENYSDYQGVGSIRDFYMASSNNKFQPIFDVYGPITLPKTAIYYVGTGKYSRYNEALKYAMETLAAQGEDFSIYDNDGDGVLDFVYFFYAGHSQADTGRTDCIWPHQSDYSYYGTLNISGKKFGPYATSSELRGTPPRGESQPYLDGIGSFCHEFGHVLGLPDLYDAPAQNGTSTVRTKTPGDWTTMDSGCYNLNSTCPPTFSAYEQWLCNWLEFTDDLSFKNEGVHGKLYPIGDDNRTAYRIRVPRATGNAFLNEYYILENRGGDKWDRGLPATGMLVWRIDYKKATWTSNKVNTGGVSNVEIISATSSARTPTYPGADGLLTAIYPGSYGELIPKNVNDLWRCYITGIKQNNDMSVEFDYNVITDTPNAVTIMHDNPFRDINDPLSVVLHWDAHPDADGYILTVTRTDARGTTRYVGYNETNVGNQNYVVLPKLTESVLDQTFKAYVRVNAGIPSSEISNTITFYPKDLELKNPAESSIETVFVNDLGVRGLRGAIEAPEEAVVYNMNGLQTGRTDLPAGIYLVKVGDKVCKVAVR